MLLRDRTKKRIIAEELASALRNGERGAEKGTCLREPNFTELYPWLGDRMRHDEIRQRNPAERHCAFLVESPMACECLPPSAGSHAGRVCPNNPYEREPELWDALREQAALLRHAHYLGDLTELGILPGTDALSPEDYLIAVMMRGRAKRQEFEIRQARAAAGLFGGGG